MQLITKENKKYLRIWATNLPSVGYKIYEILKGSPKIILNQLSVAGDQISNQFYIIKFSPSGAITEIIDRKANNKQVVLDGKTLNDLGIKNLQEGTMTVENSGSVSATLKAVSKDPILHTVRLTLFANSSRIQIEDSIQANFKDVKTWDFAFNLKNQTTRHEEVGAILTVKKETRGGHYSSQQARLDWQTFNHFADMSEENYGITLSNQDCSFFKLGESKVDSLWENSTELHALAGGQVDKKLEDKGMMGIFNQNGQKTFFYNFALTTHQNAFDPTSAMKFSLEHQNPLTTGLIEGKNGDTQNSFSLLSINNPKVLLWSVKPSEEGIEKGVITRYWNMDSKPISPIVTLSKPINLAWQTSHIETNEQKIKPLNGSLKANFNQFQMKTYRLIIK